MIRKADWLIAHLENGDYCWTAPQQLLYLIISQNAILEKVYRIILKADGQNFDSVHCWQSGLRA